MALLAGCHDGTAPAAIDAAVDAEPELPLVMTRVPDHQHTNVPTGVTLVAELNKPVTGVSATSFTLRLRDASTPVSATVTYDDTTRTARLDPDGLLAASKVYDVTLGADIIDHRGNPLSGVTRWSFRTAPDTTAPTVTTTSPASGAIDIGVDATIIVGFSEPVAHILGSSFFLAGPAGNVAGTIGYVSQTAVSLKPAAQLAATTTYRATLTSAITDFGGNQLAGSPVTWTFTTGADTVAPEVVARAPLEDDIEVAATVQVLARFSEPVVGVSSSSMVLDHGGTPVAATVSYDASKRTARLVPDAPLSPSTAYRVTLHAAITDASGNPLPDAPVSWLFTTAP